MTLNIFTQICGLVITLIIFGFYMSQRKMNIRKEKHFFRCILFTFLVLVFDIFATVLNTYKTDSALTVYVNRVYLLSTIATVFLVFLYICGESFSRKGYTVTAFTSLGIFVILTTLIINPSITDNIITCENNGTIIYTTGSATLITYITSFILIIAIVIETFVYQKYLSPKQANAIRIWMAIWIVFAITQFFYKQLLICSFGLSLGVMIMYITLQAFDGVIDNKTRLFNLTGYNQYVNERKKDMIPCPIVYLKATDALNTIDKKTLAKELDKFNSCLIKRKDLLAFANNKEYIIVLNGLTIDEFLDFLDNEREEHPIISDYYFPLYLSDSSNLESQGLLPSLVELASANINKTDGRYITIDSNTTQSYYKNIEAENLIDQAIKNDWIEVFYQPIYSIALNRFTTAEALVRIRDNEGKIIPPGFFIPVAEKNGMINKLDEIVFDKVCTFIENHDIQALGLEYIEVNLSVAQLCDDSLSGKYSATIHKHKIKPSLINLEITESAELEKRMALKRNMNRLLTFGVSFSLDDYGTGYSNLNYLVDMPVSIVKFDKQMIDAYFKDEKAKRVMEYSVRMFKSLNLKIVAEGVEEFFQVEELKLLQVDYIQGYHYSRPIPENDFVKFLEEKNK